REWTHRTCRQNQHEVGHRGQHGVVAASCLSEEVRRVGDVLFEAEDTLRRTERHTPCQPLLVAVGQALTDGRQVAAEVEADKRRDEAVSVRGARGGDRADDHGERADEDGAEWKYAHHDFLRAIAPQFFARWSAVRQASACTVNVGLRAPLVPITEAPSTPRFGTSCEKPQRSTTLVSRLSPMRVPPYACVDTPIAPPTGAR